MSLVLAENFLKSSPKCFQAYVFSGTCGKSLIGIFGPKWINFGHFLADFGIFLVLLQFWSLVFAQIFLKPTLMFLEGYTTVRTHEKIQKQGIWST